MNKKIILAITLLCSINAFSQELQEKETVLTDVSELQTIKSDEEIEKKLMEDLFKEVPGGFVYCMLIDDYNFMRTRRTVNVYFGQTFKIIKTNKYLTDKEGKPIKFNSMTGAMNYMARRGWEFVQAYISTSNDFETCHWILKKKLPE
jgi:hypothetical protein